MKSKTWKDVWWEGYQYGSHENPDRLHLKWCTYERDSMAYDAWMEGYHAGRMES